MWYTVTVPEKSAKRVPAIFFRTTAGGEPVREWLKRLPGEDRKLIGYDIQTVEFGWPIGMPVCRPLEGGVYEVRTNLPRNRIARFVLYRQVGANGFVTCVHQKSAANTAADLRLARANKKSHEKGLL